MRISDWSSNVCSSDLKMAIFDPLGMKNTWTATDPSDSIEINGTTGYDRGRPVPKDFFDGVVGDKGIYSTVEDLFIWYKALNSECLLTRETLKEDDRKRVG